MPYVYYFCQIFQALRLFPTLRLLGTLEYIGKICSMQGCQKIHKRLEMCNFSKNFKYFDTPDISGLVSAVVKL